jgi:hypothetical protein
MIPKPIRLGVDGKWETVEVAHATRVIGGASTSRSCNRLHCTSRHLVGNFIAEWPGSFCSRPFTSIDLAMLPNERSMSDANTTPPLFLTLSLAAGAPLTKGRAVCDWRSATAMPVEERQ